MANNVYFLTAHSEGPRVRERVNSIFSEDELFELAPDEWMVVFNGTTQELVAREKLANT